MNEERVKAMQTLGRATERLGQALEAQKHAEALAAYCRGENMRGVSYDADNLAKDLRANTDKLFQYFNEVLEEAKASGASPELLQLVEEAATRSDGLALLGGFSRSFPFVKMVHAR